MRQFERSIDWIDIIYSRHVAFVVLCIFFVSFGVQSTFGQAVLSQSGPWKAMPVVVLQGLDKITARVSKFEIGVGQVGVLGTLSIEVKSCKKKPPTEPPEKVAFIVIRDLKPGEGTVEIFRGWMFASSPSLNGLEHPVYDVWVLDCRKLSIQSKPSEEELK
jgi:hypothetical protein